MCDSIRDLAPRQRARKTGEVGLSIKTPTKAVVYRLRKLACVTYGRLRTIWVSREKHRALREA